MAQKRDLAGGDGGGLVLGQARCGDQAEVEPGVVGLGRRGEGEAAVARIGINQRRQAALGFGDRHVIRVVGDAQGDRPAVGGIERVVPAAVVIDQRRGDHAAGAVGDQQPDLGRADFAAIDQPVMRGAAAAAVVEENPPREPPLAGIKRDRIAVFVVVGQAIVEIVDRGADRGIAVAVVERACDDLDRVDVVAGRQHPRGDAQFLDRAGQDFIDEPDAVGGIVIVAGRGGIVADVLEARGQVLDHRHPRR